MGRRFRFYYGMNQKNLLHTTDTRNEQNEAHEIRKKSNGKIWRDMKT